MARKMNPEFDFPIERVLEKIDHPLKHRFAYLATYDGPWPEQYADEWWWKGAISSNGHPIIRFQGKHRQVHRILYHCLIGRLPRSAILNTQANPRNVNPYGLIPYDPEAHQPPAGPSEFDLMIEEIREEIEDIAPRSIYELRFLLEEHEPREVFLALQKTSYLDSLHVQSEKDLTNE